MRHVLDPSILRDGDIRGVVGETLIHEDATMLGRVLGTMVRDSGGTTACVGRDGRLQSPSLEDALVEGLVGAGMVVRRVGLCPSPALYYADRVSGADCAVMVTASHNPPDHNGFKLLMGGKPLSGRRIQDIGRRMARAEWRAGWGSVTDLPVLDRYVQRLLADYRGGRALTVVWDAGNGAAGSVLGRLTAGLPGRHLLLNDTVDGTFPAHHPDPAVAATMAQLQRAVCEWGADLGFAFDGDGDRLGVVDSHGAVLDCDEILMLLAEEVLRYHPGAPVVADVKCSSRLFSHVARLGGRPAMAPTGRSHIKRALDELAAPLAGELSGHIFIADGYYGFDDALYAAVRFLGLVSGWDEPLAARRERLPHAFATPEIRLPCANAARLVEAVKALVPASADICEIDGIRVGEEGGWWLLRASGTQAALVARCEAGSPAALDTLCRRLHARLAASGLDGDPLLEPIRFGRDRLPSPSGA
jgi:phosphomannomutase